MSAAPAALLGRDEELMELGGLLARSRVVTITGAPGVGKTRLAREFATRGWSDWEFVDLAAVSDPGQVRSAVASALSVQEVAGHSLTETVIAHLCRRPLLLLLDNCEHLLGACRELVAELTVGAPKLTVLATSREALGMAGERVLPLSPLATPGVGSYFDPDALLAYASVGLFVERASAAQPGFALSAYLAPAVAEICRQLDGIPLAIELAAARADVLTPDEIARRMEDRFGLLTERRPGGYRTLRGALDWSYDLLSPNERVVVRRVSVFAGGLDVAGAESICGADAASALDALASKSLVVRAPGGRYRLLETVRAYAGDRLQEAGEAASVQEAHARFYLGLAEGAEPGLTGPGQGAVLERLDAERVNLRRAIEWSLGHAHAEWGLRIAVALILFWRVRCHFGEGKELLAAALAASDGHESALTAKARWGLGFMILMSGDPLGAVPSLEQSLSIFREYDDRQGIARALFILGNCNQVRPGADTLPLLEESAALASEAGDVWCHAHALAVAGSESERVGEYPAARSRYEHCLRVAREGRERQGLRLGLFGLGSVCRHQGDYRSAQTLLEEAVAITDSLGEGYYKSEALQCLGWLALDQGDYVRARELVAQARAVMPELAWAGHARDSYLLLGRLAHVAGDLRGARGHFDNALAACEATGGLTVLALLWMAELTIAEGDVERGRRMLERALASARRRGHRGFTAGALHALGLLARDRGEARQAVAMHKEALELQHAIGAAPEIVRSLEALAGLAAEAGCYQHAAVLMGAAGTQRRHGGYTQLPWERVRCEADLALVRHVLASEDFEAALLRGGSLVREHAVDLALKGNGRKARPSSGWASLTEREREVAALAAQGLTNPEIAERLVIARTTVATYLAHAFAKLGVNRRTKLAGAIAELGAATATPNPAP